MESPKTAIDQKLIIDHDAVVAQRTAITIINMLDRFIPDACSKEAFYYIHEACIKHGIELTNTQMRKEYEAWKQTQLGLNSFVQSSLSAKPES